jgi:hypothetical protein
MGRPHGTIRAVTSPLPRTLEAARAAEHRGDRLRYLCFWGHQPRRDGSISAECLSQWWPAPFTVDGITYATAEHWMMAGKARLFGDNSMVERILSTPHPRAVKALGRRISGFDENAWQAHRYPLVVTGSIAKFDQNPDLRAFLLATARRVLVEASPVDRVWGIGLAATDPGAERPSQWLGLNLLGFALMDARDRIATN